MYKFKLIVTKLPIDSLRLLFSWDWKIARTFALLSTKTAGSRNWMIASNVPLWESDKVSQRLATWEKTSRIFGISALPCSVLPLLGVFKTRPGFLAIALVSGYFVTIAEFFYEGAYFLCLNYYRYIGLHLKQNNSYRHYNKATIKLN